MIRLQNRLRVRAGIATLFLAPGQGQHRGPERRARGGGNRGGDPVARDGAAIKAPRGLKPRGAGANVAFATTRPTTFGRSSAA